MKKLNVFFIIVLFLFAFNGQLAAAKLHMQDANDQYTVDWYDQSSGLPSGLPYDDVESVSVDPTGIIYVGTDGSSLFYPYSGSFSIGEKDIYGRYQFKNTFLNDFGKEWSNDYIVKSNYVTHGKIYVGTDGNGLYVGNRTVNDYQFFKVPEVKASTIYSVSSDDNGTIYLVTENGVLIGTKDINEHYTYNQYLKNEYISQYPHGLYVDKGLVYVATNDGLYVGEKESDGNYNFKKILQAKVSTVYVDSNGKIFAGTNNPFSYSRVSVGLKQGENYYFRDLWIDSISRAITSLVVDDKGTVYLTSYTNLYIGKVNANNDYDFKKVNFNTHLLFSDIYTRDVFADTNGAIYVGTSNGLAIVKHK